MKDNIILTLAYAKLIDTMLECSEWLPGCCCSVSKVTQSF